MELTTIYILAIIFGATLVRSTFGFGESLVAVPLLAFFIPIEIAVPLSVLVSVLIAAIVVIQERKKVHINSAKWLIIFAALGIPLGLLLLVYGDEDYVKAILGILIILYAGYSLISKSTFKLNTDNKIWLFFCGFLSGILGGAYGLNGPPLVIYGNLRSWSPTEFRATLQAYFLPASMIGMLGYWYNGLWSATVTHYFLICIPVILPAILIGKYLNNRLQPSNFLIFVHLALLCIGAMLLGQTLF